MEGHFHHDIIEALWILGVVVVGTFVMKAGAGYLMTRKSKAFNTWGAAVASITPGA
jgi:hypothetical protein